MLITEKQKNGIIIVHIHILWPKLTCFPYNSFFLWYAVITVLFRLFLFSFFFFLSSGSSYSLHHQMKTKAKELLTRGISCLVSSCKQPIPLFNSSSYSPEFSYKQEVKKDKECTQPKPKRLQLNQDNLSTGIWSSGLLLFIFVDMDFEKR